MPYRDFVVICAFLLSLPGSLNSQSDNHALRLSGEYEKASVVKPARPAAEIPDHPFSRLSFGGQVSPLGIEVAVSTNLYRHLNLRVIGSMFNQLIPIDSNGFSADARLRLASARTSLDVYPFHHGLRISPGLMFYNQNRVTATDTIAGGTSFTLNDNTFYSAHANQATGATPVNGSALLNLHAARPAFTITAGWGNTAPRNGHWSFPFEAGVALIGAPKIDVNLRGWACQDRGETQCADIGNPSDPIAAEVQDDLHAQVNKWTQDLDWLKTYPIVSVGVAYSFPTGRR